MGQRSALCSRWKRSADGRRLCGPTMEKIVIWHVGERDFGCQLCLVRWVNSALAPESSATAARAEVMRLRRGRCQSSGGHDSHTKHTWLSPAIHSFGCCLFVGLFVICKVALREKCRSLMLELWSFLGEIARMLVHPSALPEVCLCAFRVNKRVAPRQVPSSQRQKCNRFTLRHLLTNNSNSFKWFNEPQLKRITENEEQNLCIQRCFT